jgi:ribosome biogenesis SPOUT family RNA methylase Rps3
MMKHVGAENLVITNVSEELQQKVPESLKGATFTSKKYTELGVALSKIALLDQCGQDILTPEDAPKLDMLVCGGILGCDEFEGPMVDRTSALRVEGVRCVNLGPAQMTADTAVIVSNLILNNQKRMDELKFSDRPSIKIGKKEYVDMPFRYLLQDDGSVLLPDGMLDYLRKSDFEP